MSIRSIVTVSCAALALGVVACAHASSDPPPATATTTADTDPPQSGHTLTNENGINSLAKARCEREAQCHNLAAGDNKERHDCVQDVRDQQAKVLGPDACTSGIDKASMDKCAGLLQSQLCEGKLGPIEDFPECHADRLCAK